MRPKFFWDKDQLTAWYHGSMMTTGEISVIVGCDSETVRKALVKLDISRRPGVNIPGKKYPNKRHFGAANPSWNGGRTTDKNGYVLLLVRSHPHANPSGYVREHRLIMEKKLGRYLTPEEVVHHTGATNDNNPDKLVYYASNAEHLAATLKGKCPRWTTEGKRRISEANKGKSFVSAATRSLLNAYAERHGITIEAIVCALPGVKRKPLYRAIRAGNLTPHELLAHLHPQTT
jgi:hypothetical protein